MTENIHAVRVPSKSKKPLYHVKNDHGTLLGTIKLSNTAKKNKWQAMVLRTRGCFTWDEISWHESIEEALAAFK